MKRTFFLVLASGFMLLQACNSNNDSVDEAKDINEERDTVSAMESPGDTATVATVPVDEKDADFAVEVADDGMTEVELGKLAQQKATSERVKNYAAMLVADHSKAADDLKRIASAKQVVLPDSMSNKHRDHLDDLNKKSGTSFDKAYMDMMVDDHKKAIKKFEDAAEDCKDPDLKSFASQTLPVLRKHLDSAQAIVGKK